MESRYEESALRAAADALCEVMEGDTPHCDNPHCYIDAVTVLFPLIEKDAEVKEALLSLVVFLREHEWELDSPFFLVSSEEETFLGLVEEMRGDVEVYDFEKDPEPMMGDIFRILRALDAAANTDEAVFIAFGIISCNVLMCKALRKDVTIKFGSPLLRFF